MYFVPSQSAICARRLSAYGSIESARTGVSLFEGSFDIVDCHSGNDCSELIIPGTHLENGAVRVPDH
jgi:hypothetical protein